MALAAATALFAKFKDAYTRGDAASAKALLPQMKLQLLQLPALPPTLAPSPTAQQELTLGRDFHEHAVLLSLKLQDEALTERSFVLLKSFYADTAKALPPSPQRLPLQGLHLLLLLVQNRIAEFHTELELLSPEEHAAPYIAHAIQLERWLMEGAYNKVLDARKSPPSEFHGPLLTQLAATVRDEIASCSEKAYARLRVSEAQRMMMFESEAAVTAYAQQHGWTVKGGYIEFTAAGGDTGAKVGPAPAMGLITNALVYAKELERIV